MNNESIKLCECGCGQPAPIAKTNDKARGWFKGQPIRFISGHNGRKHGPINESSIAPKYCECGCGRLTSIATKSDASRGVVRGERLRFVPCHHPQRTLEEAFLEWATPGEPGTCWDWRGSRNDSGYGTMSYKAKEVYVHRFSYEYHNGPIPDGLIVRHKCDNPSCWNPDHLLVGTHKDNAADKMERGRHPRIAIRGSACPHSKLTEEDIPVIRQLRRDGMSFGAIGTRYGISPNAVWAIMTGKTWGHVNRLEPEPEKAK